jgi:hypothetical protein
MDNEQVRQRYEKLLEQYGDQLPCPTVEPRRFQYYVTLLNWKEQLEKLAVDSKPKV